MNYIINHQKQIIMKTYSNNFLKVALAIVLFSNSALLFYFVKQQKNQNSELTTLNTKLDLLLKNKSESQSKQATCLNVFNVNSGL